jgi:hypothetical protein
MTDIRCAHPGCECAIGPDEQFCSHHCQQLASEDEGICACGHAGCR